MKTSEQTMNIDSRAIRVGALGGVIGPALFALLVVLGGVLYEGYSHTGQKISELGGEGAEYALLQNLNFIVLGVMVIGFVWALARTLGPPYWGPVLVGMFGLSSSIANGFLPCDLGCQGETTVGLLHNITGVTGFVAAIVGMFVLARHWRSDPNWQSHVGFTRGAALVSIGGLVGFIVMEESGALSVSGVAQRVFVVALLVWITVTAVRLSRQVSGTNPLSPDSGARVATTSSGRAGE